MLHGTTDSFDIDGTLTRTQNGYLPFNEAILKTFGFAGDIRTVVPDGNTDPLIVQDIFIKADVEIAFRTRTWEQFTTQLGEQLPPCLRAVRQRFAPLPGAGVAANAGRRARISLRAWSPATSKSTARVKLEAAGLAHYLCRGAYASDSHHRPDLPAIAKERWEEATGRQLAAEQCVISAIRPKDLECARAKIR